MSSLDPEKARSSPAPTVYQIIKAQEERDPDAVAVLAPGREALTYHRLIERIEYVVGVLNSAGIGRNDRVALVLPNGPDMAVAFLAAAAGATSLPLSSDHRLEELNLYLENLDVRGMIVEAGGGANARAAVQARVIPIFELLPEAGPGAAAGVFSLDVENAGTDPSPPSRYAEVDDIALILHTSGTTSRARRIRASQSCQYLLLRSECGRSPSAHRAGPQPQCHALFHAHGLIMLI